MATPRPGEANLPVTKSPDRLDSWKEIAAYLGHSVPTVQRWEKKERLPAHRHAHEKQGSVYAYKWELDRWWAERGGEMAPHRHIQIAARISTAWQTARIAAAPYWRQIMIGTVAFSLALTSVAVWQIRTARVRWARQKALPRIQELVNKSQFFAAYQVASEAEKYIPGDPSLQRLWNRCCLRVDVITQPAGADLYLSSYSGTENLLLGRSPLWKVWMPRFFPRWRIEKPGYETAEGLFAAESGRVVVSLDKTGDAPIGMVRVTGGKFAVEMSHLGPQPDFELGDYWIDKLEVTNRDYEKFVSASGYQNPEYWTHPFIKDGRRLSFAQAMQLLRDRTGQPGPATWEAGAYPAGRGEYPVTGVSWYEAAAYAEFAGKSLPTIYHWMRAAGISTAFLIEPTSNFAGKGLARAGEYRGIADAGTYDMAGKCERVVLQCQ